MNEHVSSGIFGSVWHTKWFSQHKNISNIIYSLLLSNSTSIPESGLVHEADMSATWTCDLDGDLVFFFADVLPTFVMALPSDLPDLPLCRDGLSSQTVFTRGAGGYDNGK